MRLATIIWVALLVLFLALCFTCLGCAGTGFDKQATLMPDRIGVGFSQARYREEDAAYRGFTINAQWNLK